MTFKSKARRAGWLLLVAVFAFGIVSAIKPQPTEAYSLISSRSIKMSSSEPSLVSTPNGTNVIYTVGFTTTTTANVGSMVIRFCTNPIIGDTCTAPTGFNTNFATLSYNNGPSLGGVPFTLNTSTSTSNVLLFTRTSSNSITASTSITFDLGNGSTNGLTNPSTTNTSFFARIMLFASNSSTLPAVADDDNSPATGSPLGANNAGGVALSTANVLNVTAKVQETLVFCVYTDVNCAAGGTAVNLGTSENVLAATNLTYTDATPKFDLASNALGGVVVRLKGDTLTSGAFTISAIGGTCTADSTTTSVEQFGVRVVTYGAGQYTGSATNSTTLNSGTADDFSCLAGQHKFDPTAANTTYGQNFVKTFGATDVSSTNFELSAKAAGTTEAGVYTTKLQLIATATY